MKLICFIKAIICCVFPKQTNYYKHTKQLVDVEPEYPIKFSEKDKEMVVPTEQTKKLSKIIFSDDLEKYRQVNGSLNDEGNKIFSKRINEYLESKGE